MPICDGHDSAIITINFELVRHGIEVVYLGYHRSAQDIVRAAIQEDVQAIGISSYNGGHIEFFAEIVARLRRVRGTGIGLFGGGGGTITPADAKIMKRGGVDEIFFAGTPLDAMIQFVKDRYSRRAAASCRPLRLPAGNDLAIARCLSSPWIGNGAVTKPKQTQPCRVIGITGPGGAGKTTLIDELSLRFLAARPHERLAILSHDPSLEGGGALLGDRATMVYAQHDRVFMRSLATRGRSGGLAAGTRKSIDVLRQSGFELVLVETTGIGQEDRPFPPGLVDVQVLVMSPDYGSRLQLQKIAMLEKAHLVVVNKSDLPAAATALSEIEQRLRLNRAPARVFATEARRHADPGVSALFSELMREYIPIL